MAELKGTYTSPYSSPTFKYDISYKETGRTSSTVTHAVTVSAYMTSSSSHFGYSLNGYIKVGDKQVTVFAKGTTTWSGTAKRTYNVSVTSNTNSSSGTVNARFWTTRPGGEGKSGRVDVTGTFGKSSTSEGGTPPPPDPETGATGYIFKRVNGAWKDYCEFNGIKKRVNGAWQDAQVMRRMNDKWVQIYPGVISGGGGGGTVTPPTTSVKGGAHKYKNKYDSWQSGTARQGSWSNYGNYYGVFGIKRGSFVGNGAVTKVTSASITGKRNASGYYNNNQTIRFYRSNNSGSGTSIGYAGGFTATTGAPGQDRWMSGNRAISGLDNVRDFLNGVSRYDNLMIYSAATADYLGLSEVTLSVNYEYKPVLAIFDNPENAKNMSEKQLQEEATLNPYYTMLIYPDEVYLTLDEIFKRRLLLGIPDLDSTNLRPLSPEDSPYSQDFTVKNGLFKVKLFNIFENREAEYSLDGEKWLPLKFNIMDTVYEGNVDIAYEKIYIRVVDVKKDELLYYHTLDRPRIILT